MDLIKPQTPRQWLQIYWCYREAFPVSERKPFQIIAKMVRQGRTDIWYFRKNGAFAGFASTVNGDGLILLDYFAVTKHGRGQGIGTQALMQLQHIYSDKGLFVEIERVCPEAENYAQRQKRRDFYLRCAMEPLHTQADVFGVEMELLGSRCTMTFRQYRDFYRDHYSPWAAEHIKEIE